MPPQTDIAAPSPSQRMKRISVDIDEQSHRALKTAAAERGVTIAEVVRQLVQHWTHTPRTTP